jgi:hypothetical protein
LLQFALLGVCAALAPRRALAQAAPAVSARLGDAHAHLFNMADLPVRGFLRHVGLPPGLERNGPVPALLDLIDKLRPLAVSAEQELRHIEQNLSAEPVPSWKLFDEAMVHIREGEKRSSIGRPGLFRLVKLAGRPLELADSYGLLAAILDRLDRAAARRGLSLRQALGVREPGEPDVIFGGTERPLSSGLADRLLRLLGGGGSRCPEAPRGKSEMSFAAIRAQLQWIHLMVQPRRTLLKRYREVVSDGSGGPGTVVNLLVDYDRWLADLPSRGSHHHDQIAFWTRLSRDSRPGIDIRTFAGFDPLRHAEERADGRSAYLDSLLGFWRRRWDRTARHGVHGFKLYPPMGFAPSGNVAWMFEGDSPTVQTVRARWAGRFPDRLLHEELNLALDDFFERCAAEGVPVLAHAFHSNEAGRCFGSRASPRGWAPVLTKHTGLKICLGHFADAGDFARGMELLAGEAAQPPHHWPFTGTGELLAMNAAGKGRIYADISYMSELLLLRKGKGQARARQFFLDLKAYCGKYDPGCRHFLFGTDWLLLAREDRNQEYVAVIRQAMAEARWEQDWQDNLLHANLARFLEPAGA